MQPPPPKFTSLLSAAHLQFLTRKGKGLGSNDERCFRALWEKIEPVLDDVFARRVPLSTERRSAVMNAVVDVEQKLSMSGRLENCLSAKFASLAPCDKSVHDVADAWGRFRTSIADVSVLFHYFDDRRVRRNLTAANDELRRVTRDIAYDAWREALEGDRERMQRDALELIHAMFDARLDSKKKSDAIRSMISMFDAFGERWIGGLVEASEDLARTCAREFMAQSIAGKNFRAFGESVFALITHMKAYADRALSAHIDMCARCMRAFWGEAAPLVPHALALEEDTLWEALDAGDDARTDVRALRYVWDSPARRAVEDACVQYGARVGQRAIGDTALLASLLAAHGRVRAACAHFGCARKACEQACMRGLAGAVHTCERAPQIIAHALAAASSETETSPLFELCELVADRDVLEAEYRIALCRRMLASATIPPEVLRASENVSAFFRRICESHTAFKTTSVVREAKHDHLGTNETRVRIVTRGLWPVSAADWLRLPPGLSEQWDDVTEYIREKRRLAIVSDFGSVTIQNDSGEHAIPFLPACALLWIEAHDDERPREVLTRRMGAPPDVANALVGALCDAAFLSEDGDIADDRAHREVVWPRPMRAAAPVKAPTSKQIEDDRAHKTKAVIVRIAKQAAPHAISHKDMIASARRILNGRGFLPSSVYVTGIIHHLIEKEFLEEKGDQLLYLP